MDGFNSPSTRASAGSSDVRSRLDSATNELRLLRSESGLASKVNDVTLSMSAEHERSLAELRASLQELKHTAENLAGHISRLAMQTSKRMSTLEEARQQSFRQLSSRLEALEAKSCCPLPRVQELEARVAALDEASRPRVARVDVAVHEASFGSKARIESTSEVPAFGYCQEPESDRGAAEVAGSLGHSEPENDRGAWSLQVGTGGAATGYLSPRSTPAQTPGDSWNPRPSSPGATTPTPVQSPTASWNPEMAAIHMWSTDQTHVLCAAGEEATIEGKAPHLDQFSSVSQAVEHLNSNRDVCPDGMCTVFSSSQGSYVLLFRSDMVREAFATFELDLSPAHSLGEKTLPAGGPAGKGDGGLFRSLMGRLNTIVSDRFTAKPTTSFNPSNLVMTHAANLGDRYEILRQLGAGVQGTTHLVRRNNTGVEYVAKETNDNGADEDAGDDLLKEFQKLQELRHPNCVKVIELLQGKQGKAFVILEYARGGDLYKYAQVALEQNGLTETLIAGIFKQAMQGVAYLHTQDCVHNDLKPDNLLCLDAYDLKKVPRCVITDYGCARFFKTEQQFKFGDPRYQSPENLESMMAFLNADSWVQVDTRPKGDVWSMGATLYELLSGGVIPFLYDRCSLQSLQEEGIFERLKGSILSQDEVVLQPHCSDVSEAAEGVLRMMLRKNEEARPTAQAVLSDPWFKTKTKKRISSAVARHVEFTAVKDQARQILLNAVTARLQNDHMQASQDIFRRFDTENVGKITREGFKKALERMKQDTSRADEIFDSADITGDGTLEFNEFAAMTFDWSAMDAQTLDANIQDLLNDLSADGRGTIKESELAKLFGDSVKADELRSLFTQIDSQNAGQLSKTEVRKFLLQQTKTTMPALSLDIPEGSFYYAGDVGKSFT